MKKLFLFLLFLVVLAGATYHFYPHVYPEWVRAHIHQWLGDSEDDQDDLTLYGNVDIRQVDLGFRVKGKVQGMRFQEGDFVPAGTLMAKLDKQPYLDQVKQAAARIASVKASLNNATQLVERRRQLVGTGAIADQDVDDAVSARNSLAANLEEAQASLGVAETNLRDTELYAPADGVILTRIREPGTVVREADPIYTLSLSTPIWVRAFVSEIHLGQIYPGMPAEVHTDTPDGKIYDGHIGFISPTAEFTPKTVETTQLRTDLVYRLRVIANNPDNGLRQGMPVTVKLKLPQKEERQPITPHAQAKL